MDRWNSHTNNHVDGSPTASPVYQNVQTLKGEIERLNELSQHQPVPTSSANNFDKNQLLRHQQFLENALADLELTSKNYSDINGNQYYPSMTMPSIIPTSNHFHNKSTTNSARIAQQNSFQPESSCQDDALYANMPTIGSRQFVQPTTTNNHYYPQHQSATSTSVQSGIQSRNPIRPTVTHQHSEQSSASSLGPSAKHVELLDNDSSIYANYPLIPSDIVTPIFQQQAINKHPTVTANHQQTLQQQRQAPITTTHRSKADQVDHLTDLLVKSMENSTEPDFFGMCNKCGEKVIGEGNGCTAMEMVYHIQCFTCTDCQTELRGKSFYALENNPFCEECYLNTLEKCCVCEKPILDRILRATGKPYHPSCFTCVICRKSLDGIPFTVDATNQVHCIDCFHEKFAPRCSVCNTPIVPESGKTETVRVVALDRSFHVACYKCEDCDLLLSSEAEGRGCYPLDDHILCRNCNAKRVQEITA